MLFLLNNTAAPFLQLIGPPNFSVSSPTSVSISQGNQGERGHHYNCEWRL